MSLIPALPALGDKPHHQLEETALASQFGGRPTPHAAIGDHADEPP